MKNDAKWTKLLLTLARARARAMNGAKAAYNSGSKYGELNGHKLEDEADTYLIVTQMMEKIQSEEEASTEQG